MINRIFYILLFVFLKYSVYSFAQNNNHPSDIQYNMQEPKLMAYISSLSYDEEMKSILHPFYVYIDKFNKNLFVIDSRGSRILVYDQHFFPLYTLDKRWGINSPVCIVSDVNGNLYVLNLKPCGQAEIIKLNRALFVEKVYPMSEKDLVLKIAVDERERVYVVMRSKEGENGYRVVVLDRDGNIVRDINPVENGVPVPIDEIKIDRKGRIFLVSTYNSKIYVYDKDFNFLFKFGEKGGVTGKLSNPKGIGIDEERDLAYIVDYMRHAVNVYSLKEGGKYLFEFGGYGIGVEGWFAFPSSVDVDWEGRVYVADTFNSRIQILTPYEGAVNIKIPANRVVKFPEDKTNIKTGLISNFEERLIF